MTVAASPATANSALVNASEVNGKVALVWNDDCDHATKARNCWQAGAIGVVIINQVDISSKLADISTKFLQNCESIAKLIEQTCADTDGIPAAVGI
eukprot:SAG31_NODE_1688_length_7528_cov_14.515143_3_plen_96_part_00